MRYGAGDPLAQLKPAVSVEEVLVLQRQVCVIDVNPDVRRYITRCCTGHV